MIELLQVLTSMGFPPSMAFVLVLFWKHSIQLARIEGVLLTTESEN
jgi:hypothetical protein